jgi:hypothetical protein
MTRKSLVTQAELKRMAALANAENVTVEIERDGTIVRVMPFHPTRMMPKPSREEEAESSLQRWLSDKATRALPDAPAPKSPRAGRRWGS